ncbi:MAG: type 4a pilus biogenesis protein PilO [Planctomycetota bacterium]
MLYLSASRPITSWRADLGERTRQLQTALRDGPSLRRNHAALSEQFSGLMTRVEDVMKAMPDEPRDDEFLADISRLAIEHGVQIDDFRRGAVTENDTHAAVTVMLSVQTPYRGLCGLIHAIDELPRLAELEELRVESEAYTERYPVTLHYTLYYALAAGAT